MKFTNNTLEKLIPFAINVTEEENIAFLKRYFQLGNTWRYGGNYIIKGSKSLYVFKDGILRSDFSYTVFENATLIDIKLLNKKIWI